MAQLPLVWVYHDPLQIATFWEWLAIYFHHKWDVLRKIFDEWLWQFRCFSKISGVKTHTDLPTQGRSNPQWNDVLIPPYF